jgi:hypothetical protein
MCETKNDNTIEINDDYAMPQIMTMSSITSMKNFSYQNKMKTYFLFQMDN